VYSRAPFTPTNPPKIVPRKYSQAKMVILIFLIFFFLTGLIYKGARLFTAALLRSVIWYTNNAVAINNRTRIRAKVVVLPLIIHAMNTARSEIS
jgi:hypothetical protein